MELSSTTKMSCPERRHNPDDDALSRKRWDTLDPVIEQPQEESPTPEIALKDQSATLRNVQVLSREHTRWAIKASGFMGRAEPVRDDPASHETAAGGDVPEIKGVCKVCGTRAPGS